MLQFVIFAVGGLPPLCQRLHDLIQKVALSKMHVRPRAGQVPTMGRLWLKRPSCGGWDSTLALPSSTVMLGTSKKLHESANSDGATWRDFIANWSEMLRTVSDPIDHLAQLCLFCVTHYG